MVASDSWTYGILLEKSTRSCYLLFVLLFPACHGLINQVAPSVLCFVWQLRCRASSSPGFLVIRLSVMCDVFLVYCCRSLHYAFSIECDVRVMYPKYFNFLVVTKVSRECLSLIWLHLHSPFLLDVVFWAIVSTSIARKHQSFPFLSVHFRIYRALLEKPLTG